MQELINEPVNISGYLISSFHCLKSKRLFSYLLWFFLFWIAAGNIVSGQCTVNVIIGRNVTCFNGNDGQIIASVTGGTAPYTFTISPNIGTQSPAGTFNGLTAQTYTVRATDNLGTICSEATETITQPGGLFPGSINTDLIRFCAGGTFPIAGTYPPYGPATGGSGSYTYTWQMQTGCAGAWTDIPGSNSTSYTPAAPGSTTCYRRKVTDNLCLTEVYTGAKTFEIYPDLVSQSIVSTPSNTSVCAGTLISATFTGGSGGFPGSFTDTYDYSTNTGTTWSPYTPGQQISTTGLSGVNLIQVRTRRIPTGSDGCDYGSFVTVSWTVNALPVATAGSNSPPVCAGTTLNLTSGGGTSYIWTGPNSFSSSQQNPSIPSVTTAASGTYTVTVTTAAGCTSNASTTVTIIPSVTPSVSITASPGSTVCTGTSVTFTAVPTNGGAAPAFQWRVNGGNTGTGTTFTSSSLASGDQVTCVMTSSEVCASPNPVTSNIITMTVNAIPVITGTTPASRCGAGTVTLGATASAGTINWYTIPTGGSSIGTGTSFITPGISATTVFYADATNNGCTTASRTPVTATVYPSPTATVTGTTSVCFNSSPAPIITFTGAGGTPPYTFTYNINGGASQNITTTSGNSVTLSQPTGTAGTYIYNLVSVRDANSCTNVISGSATITVWPQLTAPSICCDQQLCYLFGPPPNGNPLTISLPVTGGSGSYSYQWQWSNTGNDPWNNNPNNIPTGPYTKYYRLVVTDNNGCGTVISNSVSITTTFSFSGSFGGTGNPTSPVCSGYSFTYTITSGSLDLFLGRYIRYVVSANPLYVNPSSGTYGTGFFFIYTANINFTVTNNTGSQVITPINVTPTLFNSNGTVYCTLTPQTFNVTINTIPPTPSSISGPANVCPATAGISYSTPAIPGATTYTWTVPTGWTITGGAGTNTITVTSGSSGQNGNITVRASNSCGQSGTRSLAVTVNSRPAIPTITPPGPITICPGATVTLTSSAGTGYLWSTGAVTPSINVTTAGSYTVQISDAAGCFSLPSAPVVVTVNPAPPTPGAITGPSNVCPGAAGINYSVAVVPGADSYIWTVPIGWTITGGSGTNAITVTAGAAGQNGNITVSAFFITCGASTPSSLAVAVNTPPAAPTITAGGSTAFCPGGSVTLTSSPGSSYLWSTGAVTPSINATVGGNYTVQVADAAGCQSPQSAPITVTVYGLPGVPTIAASGPTTFCSGGSVTLTSTFSTGGYLWSTGATSQSINVTTTGSYRVTVFNAQGCSRNSAFTSVTVNPAPASPVQTIDCSLGIGNATVTVTSPTGAGLEYRLDAGTPILWPSLSFTGVEDGSHTITVRNTSGGCTTTGSSFQVACGCPSGPTLTLSSISGTTCGITPVTISGNTFGGTATSVTITENGAGSVSPATTSTSPFIFTYTPLAGDAGNTVIITLTTDDPDGAGQCLPAIATYTLLVVGRPAPPTTGNQNQAFCSLINPTLANLNVTGANIQWYTTPSGGSPLPPATALVSGTYYASQTAGGCESSARLQINVVVYNPAAPTGTSPQSFCAINNPTIADLTLRITGTNIQWYSTSTGGTPLSTATVLVNGTTYYASQRIPAQGNCESSTRLAVNVIVSNPAAPTGTSPQTFCAINNPTVANLSATGTNIQWYTTSTGGSALSSSTALVNGSYYASQTLSGCESSTRLVVVVSIGAPAAPTGAASQFFCGINNPTLASIVVTATGTVTWYDAATAGNVLAPATALVDGITYYASQTVSGCESSTRLAVTVTVGNPVPPSGASSQDFCAINNPTVANLIATGTNIQWYTTAIGGSPLASSTALADGTYYASQTVAGCESSTRLTVTVTIGNPAAPTRTSPQSFCAIINPTVADLTATGASIQWYTAATGGTPMPPATALVNSTYYASQTVSGCESITRLPVDVTVGAPPAPTGSSPQTFCAIDNPTVATLSATGANIQWYTTATGGTPLISTTALVDGTTYYASQTVTGCESSDRLAVPVVVISTAAPTGTSPQLFCASNNPTIGNLVATGTNVQWYTSASGGTALLSSTALIDGTTYYASQTVAGCESSTRLPVAVTVTNSTAPTGTTPQTFCAIDNPTVGSLTATGTNIQWYTTATGGTPLATATTLISGTYYASQTVSGCESTTRFAVDVTVGNPAAPTGTSPQTFCAIDNPIVSNLNATGTGIQWFLTASGGTALPQATALVNGITYYASQTVSGCESPTRLSVAVNIGDPAAPTGNSPQAFCVVNNPTIASLIATGTGLQWYTTVTGGTPLPPATDLVDGTTYYATQTVSGCESATRLAVEVTVTNTAPPTGSSPQSFCSIDNPTVANLTATGTNIQWYSAPSGGTPLATVTALATGTYYASQTVSGCESSTRLAVIVNVGNSPTPTGPSPQAFCAVDNPTVANLNATGTNIQWYITATGGTPLPATTTLTDGITYYASQNNTGCESSVRLAVAVTVGNPVAPTGTSPQTFCSINNPTVVNLSATGTNIQWYITPTGGTPLPGTTALSDATIYYASQTIAGCESRFRLPVAVTITVTTPPSGISPQSFCAANNPTVANLNAIGTSIQWYATSTGGTPLAPATALVNGTTYYASQTVAGCESDIRLAVTVTVNASPVAAITPEPAVLCANGFINLNGNPSGGSGIYTTHLWTGTGAVYLNNLNIQNPVFSGAPAGPFALTYTVTDSRGCVGSDNLIVTVSPLPTTSAIYHR